MHQTLKARNGTTLRQRRYQNLPLQLDPLDPTGVNTPPIPLNAVNVDTQIQWYGGYILLTSQVVLQSIEDVLSEGGSLLTQCLRETRDVLIWNMLAATASTAYASLGSNGDFPTNITADDLQLVVDALTTASAMRFTEVVQGENRFGTQPILPCYVGMGHTDTLADLRATYGWQPSSSYPRPDDIFFGEYGTSGYVRMLLSPLAYTAASASSNGNTVYTNIITGREGYQCVALDTYSSSIYYVPPGASIADPLRRLQSIGMVFTAGQAITNYTWTARLLTTRLR